MKRDDPSLHGNPSHDMSRRGTEDGAHGFPANDADGRAVVQSVANRYLVPQREANAARVELDLGALKDRTATLAIDAEELQRAVAGEAARAASDLDSALGHGRINLAAAGRTEHAATRAVMLFLEEHRHELGGRDPLPVPTRMDRFRGVMGRWVIGLAIVLTEVGSFVALGADALREAIPRGLIGGILAAALVWCLGAVLHRRRLQLDPDERHRDAALATLVLSVLLALAYGMACMRDALLLVNHEEALTLAKVLKAPLDLSPDSGLVLAVAITLVIVTVLLEYTRCLPFPEEQVYRDLVAARTAAINAYAARCDELDSAIKAAGVSARDRISSIVDGWAQAARSAGRDFSDATARVRHWHKEDAEAVATARNALGAYCRANAAARGLSNPLPAALVAPVPFEPSPGLHRDLLAGFASELKHARRLEQAARQAASQVVEALGSHEADAIRFAVRLRANPLTEESPPRYFMELQVHAGPAFDPAGGPDAPSSGAIDEFLGKD